MKAEINPEVEFEPIFEVGDWIRNINLDPDSEEKLVIKVDTELREYTLVGQEQAAKGQVGHGDAKVAFDAQYCFIKVD